MNSPLPQNITGRERPLPPLIRLCSPLAWWGVTVGVLAVSGCAQMAIVGKMFFGDPKVTSAFAQVTGESLQDGGRVAIFCTTPDSVHSKFDTLSVDLQEELMHRLSRRDIDVIDSDAVMSALDDNAGIPDPDFLAQKLDCDFLVHIDVEHFTHLETGSRDLLRGRAIGNVYGYAMVEDETYGRQARQVFEQEFRSEYPTTHPISIDQTPEKVFRQRFIDHLSDQLGRMFYDFRTSDVFSH